MEEKGFNVTQGMALLLLKPLNLPSNFVLNILFCGCDPRLKKDMHESGKSIGFNPSYSIKHTPLDPCSPKQSYNFVVPFKVKYLLFPFSHLTNLDFL